MFRGADVTKDHDDPLVAEFQAHDTLVLDMRERLLKAVTSKKSEVLPLAVNIFNKVQDTHFKTFRLDGYGQAEEKSQGVDDINESLKKLDLLLNGNSSPVLSAIKQTSKYATSPLPDTLEDYE